MSDPIPIYETKVKAFEARSPEKPIMPTKDLLAILVQQGADLATLKQFMEFQAEEKADRARQAYFAAMIAFKASPPEISKQTPVAFGKTSYMYASLDHISDAINKALSQHGLFVSWKQSQEAAFIKVTCQIAHEEGHVEETSLTAGADLSGAKNAIQALGSTITYLQRYTLLSLTGLAARGSDDDGHGSQTVKPITAKQLEDLPKLQKVAKITNVEFKARLIKKFNVAKVADLTEAQAATLLKALEAAK